MKRLKQILIAVLFLTSILSCKKDEKETKDDLNKETISAKWVVDGTSVFESFEFNESGNYIVVENTTTKSVKGQIVLFGTYEIIDNVTIVLSDLGTMKISQIAESSIDFQIALESDPSNEISITALKQEVIPNSTNTNLLCRTWELISFGGEEMSGFIVLFSDAGTYFVESTYGNGIGTWKWCDSEESKIAFTISKELNCDGLEIIKEIQLTSDSFTGIDMENVDPMEMIMQPVSISKSAPLINQKNGGKIFGIVE
jgi:hypothetical protein